MAQGKAAARLRHRLDHDRVADAQLDARVVGGDLVGREPHHGQQVLRRDGEHGAEGVRHQLGDPQPLRLVLDRAEDPSEEEVRHALARLPRRRAGHVVLVVLDRRGRRALGRRALGLGRLLQLERPRSPAGAGLRALLSRLLLLRLLRLLLRRLVLAILVGLVPFGLFLFSLRGVWYIRDPLGSRALRRRSSLVHLLIVIALHHLRLALAQPLVAVLRSLRLHHDELLLRRAGCKACTLAARRSHWSFVFLCGRLLVCRAAGGGGRAAAGGAAGGRGRVARGRLGFEERGDHPALLPTSSAQR
eukprot:scaffold34926_cov48-Phaeocystis_antarctica.AAC.1